MFFRKHRWMMAAAVLLSVAGIAADEPDAERLFSRHSEEEWRPLVERWAEVKAQMTTPVENLALPLDYHANGRVKARLRAEKAQIFLDGAVFAEGVEVELLTETGAPDGRLKAEGCLFDRKAKHGWCEGVVSVEKDGDRLKGRGMYFSIEEQFIKIMAECEIRTSRIGDSFGRLK